MLCSNKGNFHLHTSTLPSFLLHPISRVDANLSTRVVFGVKSFQVLFPYISPKSHQVLEVCCKYHDVVAKRSIYIHSFKKGHFRWKLPLESQGVLLPLLAKICLSSVFSRSPVNARIGMKGRLYYSLWVNHHHEKQRKNESALFPLMSTGWKTKKKKKENFFLENMWEA